MRIAIVFLLALSACACGQQAPEQPPMVSDAWIRGAPPTAAVLAGYLRLTAGNKPLALTGARCGGFGATEIHRTVMQDGVAGMRAIERLELGSGDTVEFAPGGYHLMLMRPAAVPGTDARVACAFLSDGGGEIPFEAIVRGGAADDGDSHDHHH